MPRFASRLTLVAVLPASLFVGLMFATAGVAVHPPLAFIATPLVCAGDVEVESQLYSYRPGQSGVSRTIWCARGGGAGKPAREDISLKAIGASFLVYSVLAFAVLQLLAWRLRRSRLGQTFGRASAIEQARAAAGIDLSTILSQVAASAERRDGASVRKVRFDLRAGDGPSGEAGADDPAERLTRLERLRDQGLITADEYQAKRAEILSGL